MRVGLGMAALGRPGYINLRRDDHLPSSRTVEGMRIRAYAVMDELFRLCRELNDDDHVVHEDDHDNYDGDDGIVVEQRRKKFVPWLDCARSYGLSEEFVGDYLRLNNIMPEDVYVSSKWGYTYVADWRVELDDGESHEIKDHSLENFLKQVEETNANVGPYLDLYQVHSATFESGILANVRVHEAMHRICRVERGWKIGFSVSGAEQDELIREALGVRVPIISGNDDDDDDDDDERTTPPPPRRLFDSVQCTYNILEQRPAEALLEAHAAGMDIIVKEGLANGRALQHPRLLELSSALDCEPDQLALGAILSQPFRPRVLSGAVSVDQLRSNFGSMYHRRRSANDAGGDISAAETTTCRSGVQEILTSTNEGQESLRLLMSECRLESEKYWGDRSNLRWN